MDYVNKREPQVNLEQLVSPQHLVEPQ